MAGSTTKSQPFAEVSRIGLTRAGLLEALARHDRAVAPRLALLWAYYRNPMESCVPVARSGGVPGRGFRLAQERGLPARIRGNWAERAHAAAIADDLGWSRKEVVIENDIAWRIHTMVDFMFGRPVVISSTARGVRTRRIIERVLDAVWEASGGIALLHDLGLLGHVYGHVDLVVRAQTPTPGMRSSDPTTRGSSADTRTDASTTDSSATATPGIHADAPAPTDPSGPGAAAAPAGATPREAVVLDEHLLHAARNCVRIEIVDPARGVALPGGAHPQAPAAYIIRSTREAPATEANSAAAVAGAFAETVRRWWQGEASSSHAPGASGPRPRLITTTEVFSGGSRQVFEASPDGETRLIEESPALIEAREQDAPPIVHIQNISQPFAFAGLSEVEPLIPLQDELNTRLSDRASRVTMMSFKMYLAKGIDGAEKLPIGPGIVWSSDNAEAQIQTFGGDAAAPSEDAHIEQVREALDKASGVPPLASGVVRAKIGNLSSENALKITLMGLLSKTARKRITYARGLADASRLILDALDRAGILTTDPADRAVRIDWTDPLPRDERQALDAARAKIELGVPRERVLNELGYGTTDQGLT